MLYKYAFFFYPAIHLTPAVEPGNQTAELMTFYRQDFTKGSLHLCSLQLTWMGVLMEARCAWPDLRRSLLFRSGSGRVRPSSVETKGTGFSLRAWPVVFCCHLRTSLRSAYHLCE